MTKFLTLFILTLAAIAAWRIGATLSSDAVSMAVGVLFGVLAGVPSAVLAMPLRPVRQAHWPVVEPVETPAPPVAELVEAGYWIQPTPNGWQITDLSTNQQITLRQAQRITRHQLITEVNK